MQVRIYKLRKNRMISGVLAGVSDKFGWNLQYLRLLFFVFSVFNPVIGVLVYVLASHFLTFKEDRERKHYGQGPRRIKEAEKIKPDGNWFW
ncbi:PspC domain-containing protein [Streptococcus moroccensis]|uniref:Phage shock protein PspC (Stress-responsive transcriptional regulator) n=1 Tax=Streptococcus moroccensis TaxID=1451356 RepID=A0ABT9YRB3_9STRE|nr:PspC domain-containing protein [Streptococcus moroccensis]MDQ0222536.1 phage shock protein PspC (stress-responsive transcriptional regulator) [Streptococcus moroccensis]